MESRDIETKGKRRNKEVKRERKRERALKIIKDVEIDRKKGMQLWLAR